MRGAGPDQALGGIHRQPAASRSTYGPSLTKLEAGEADAGLVYRTDVVASGGKVDAIALPTPVTTTYWISVVTGIRGACSGPGLRRTS